MGIDLQPVLQMFRAESEEGLSIAEQAVVALESRPEDDECLGTIFRATHTLKGNASSLGFQALTEFAHVLEDILDRLRKRELKATTPLITLLLRSIDALRQMVPDAVSGTEGMRPEHRTLLKRLVRARSAMAGALSVTDEPSPAEDADDNETVAGERRRGPGRRWFASPPAA